MATASIDRTVRIWDAKTGQELLTLVGHTNQVEAVVFSRQGDQVYSKALSRQTFNDSRTIFKKAGKNVKVWDAVNGQQQPKLVGHKSSVRSVSISPDGRRIASGSDDNTIKIWDAETAAEIQTISGSPTRVNYVEYSRDGKLLIAGTGNWDGEKSGAARVWDSSTGEELFVLYGHDRILSYATFNRDTTKIATLGFSTLDPGGRLEIWDVNSRDVVQAIENVTSVVAFDPEPDQIVGVTHEPGTGLWVLKIWDASNGREIRRVAEYPGSLSVLAVHGQRILTASPQRAIIWDALTGKALLNLKGHSALIEDGVFSPTGERIVTCSTDGTLRIWDSLSGQETFNAVGHSGRATKCIAFNPDGRSIASGGEDREIALWQAKKRKISRKIRAHHGPVKCVSLSPDGKLIASGGTDNAVRVWETVTGRERFELSGGANGRQANWVGFSPDGQRLIAAFIDNSVRVWNVNSGELDRTISHQTSRVMAADFDDSGSLLATASTDDTLQVVDILTGAQIHKVKAFENLPDYSMPGLDIHVSSNGSRILCASGKGEAISWDVGLGTKSIFSLDERLYKVVAISPDGRLIAASPGDKSVSIWSADTGKVVCAIEDQTQDIRAIAFTSDSEYLVAGGRETLRLWNASSGNAVASFPEHVFVVCIALNSTNDVLVSGGDGQLTISNLRHHADAGDSP